MSSVNLAPTTNSNSWVCIETQFNNLLLEQTRSGTIVILPFFSFTFSSSEVPTFVGVNSITTEGAIKNEFDKLGKFKLASSSLNDNSY